MEEYKVSALLKAMHRSSCYVHIRRYWLLLLEFIREWSVFDCSDDTKLTNNDHEGTHRY